MLWQSAAAIAELHNQRPRSVWYEQESCSCLKPLGGVSSGFLLVVSRLAAAMFLNSNSHAQCSPHSYPHTRYRPIYLKYHEGLEKMYRYYPQFPWSPPLISKDRQVVATSVLVHTRRLHLLGFTPFNGPHYSKPYTT